MEHIGPITPTESATDSTVIATPLPAKRPWQTPTCTKFTTEELTERGLGPLFIDATTSRAS